jgi:hypothetical protein
VLLLNSCNEIGGKRAGDKAKELLQLARLTFRGYLQLQQEARDSRESIKLQQGEFKPVAAFKFVKERVAGSRVSEVSRSTASGSDLVTSRRCCLYNSVQVEREVTRSLPLAVLRGSQIRHQKTRRRLTEFLSRRLMINAVC